MYTSTEKPLRSELGCWKHKCGLSFQAWQYPSAYTEKSEATSSRVAEDAGNEDRKTDCGR